MRFTIIDFVGQMYTTDGITEEGDRKIFDAVSVLTGYNSVIHGNPFEFLSLAVVPGHTITLTGKMPKIRKSLIV
jgi:hypothetical protein